ncbi:serpin [Eastern grey kangaroopox virus]|uniref:Serpin n=1 Tax=Eastern grey kangaroopox virus TaxID=2042482 RepID=A0A2C9DTB9_9POXV|nr:serpin [Eastern grey kangaroopox virus]ATI21252.1 serpin [Eastern grey kangaroopox virus]ATX75157.1 serpin [Eastern grey kangaroopox virus]
MPLSRTFSGPSLLTSLPAILTMESRDASLPPFSELGCDLYSIVNLLTVVEDNIAISPLSVSVSMMMLILGSDGWTRDKLLRAAYLDRGSSDPHESMRDLLLHLRQLRGCLLEIANAMFVDEDYPFSERYASNLEEYYGATVTCYDFHGGVSESASFINRWIRILTGNTIPEVVKHIDASSRMVMVSAMYLKGRWALGTGDAMLEIAKFTDVSGRSSEVEMLRLNNATMSHCYLNSIDSLAIEIPYEFPSDISMILLLPGSQGLNAVESSLTPEFLAKVRSRLEPAQFSLRVPLFSLESSLGLNACLMLMGVNVFDGSADLTGICEDPGLVLSDLLHRCSVHVEGAGPSDPKVYHAVPSDRPDLPSTGYPGNSPIPPLETASIISFPLPGYAEGYAAGYAAASAMLASKSSQDPCCTGGFAGCTEFPPANGGSKDVPSCLRGSEYASSGGKLVLSRPELVTVDRPFIFLVTHRDTGSILVIGKFCYPFASKSNLSSRE